MPLFAPLGVNEYILFSINVVDSVDTFQMTIPLWPYFMAITASLTTYNHPISTLSIFVQKSGSPDPCPPKKQT